MSPEAGTPVREQVRDQAIDWFVRLASGQASADDHAALANWRAAAAEHERAWQRVAQLGQRLQGTAGVAPAPVARAALGASQRLRRGRRQTLKLLGAAGFGVGLAGSTVFALRDQPALRHAFADHRTATGERRTLLLADGSRLTLNTRTAVDVRFDAQQRHLCLRSGEIEIVTAQDAAGRGFSVETADGRLTPLGTRFTVRRMEDEAQTRVAVSEGRVRIAAGGAGMETIVAAGEETRFSAVHVEAPRPLAVATLAWTRGMLAADRTRLGDFITELGRHRPGVLRCDPAVAGLRITGAYPLDDTDRVLAVLEQTLPVRVGGPHRYWRVVGAR